MPSKPAGRTDLLSDIDRLINEPARYNIVALLYVLESAEFLFVKHQTGMTAGNLSAHLRKLEAAGYVKIEKGFSGNFPQTTLKLTKRGRTNFEEYRKKMQQALGNLPARPPKKR